MTDLTGSSMFSPKASKAGQKQRTGVVAPAVLTVGGQQATGLSVQWRLPIHRVQQNFQKYHIRVLADSAAERFSPSRVSKGQGQAFQSRPEIASLFSYTTWTGCHENLGGYWYCMSTTAQTPWT